VSLTRRPFEGHISQHREHLIATSLVDSFVCPAAIEKLKRQTLGKPTAQIAAGQTSEVSLEFANKRSNATV
jgi:hypothetical protein